MNKFDKKRSELFGISGSGNYGKKLGTLVGAVSLASVIAACGGGGTSISVKTTGSGDVTG